MKFTEGEKRLMAEYVALKAATWDDGGRRMVDWEEFSLTVGTSRAMEVDLLIADLDSTLSAARRVGRIFIGTKIMKVGGKGGGLQTIPLTCARDRDQQGCGPVQGRSARRSAYAPRHREYGPQKKTSGGKGRHRPD